MTNSQAFKLAHTMTKQVIQTGDDYQTTFGLCLKAVKAQKSPVIQATTTYFKTNTLTINFLILVTIMMMVIKLVTVLKDSVEPILFFGLILFNPFNLVIYNGIYLAVVGG